MTAKTPIAMVVALLAVLAFSAAPALAAAPEEPLTEAASSVTGTTATFKGELIPATSTEKVTYHFAYSAGAATTCTRSGMRAPGEPFPKAEDNEKVSLPVTELEGSTTYTYCLVANSPEGETTGTPQTFTTLASKPVIVSEAPTAITPFDASLEAVLNPERRVTTYHFEYAFTKLAVEKGEGTSVGESSTPAASDAQGTGPVDIGGGLDATHTYFFRLVTSSTNGVTDGPVESFETKPLEAPVIEGESVTGVTQTNAELHATINPEHQTTYFQFQLGLSTSYGLGPVPASPRGELAASFGGSEVGVNLAGESVTLAPNTEYHYETLATNATGSVEGLTSTLGDQTFLTLPEPPTVSTGGASAVTATGARVVGTVAPRGLGPHEPEDATSYYFQYGGTTSYGKETAVRRACLDECPMEESSTLAGLEPGRTYHYRIVASDLNNAQELNEHDAGEYGGSLKPQVVYGQDEAFTTPATPPIMSEVSVHGITQNAATITATLEPQGLATRWELQLGATPGMLQPLSSGDTAGTITLELAVGLLSPSSTYYYKLTATNSNGTSEGEGSLKTAPAPAGSPPALLPALIPYQSIAELNAKEAKEDNGLPPPTITKSLTNAEKLKKALKTCEKKKGAKRAICKKQAHERYGAPNKRKK